MENNIKQILLTEEQIQNRIRELGESISAEYAGKNPIIVGVLKGVVVFSATSKFPARWTLCACPLTRVPIPPAEP